MGETGRLCGRCERPLTPEFHDIGPARLVIARRGRGRARWAKVRTYDCKMRLVGTSPVSGKTFVPESGQRLASLDVRYVHEGRFAPGKDLDPQ